MINKRNIGFTRRNEKNENIIQAFLLFFNTNKFPNISHHVYQIRIITHPYKSVKFCLSTYNSIGTHFKDYVILVHKVKHDHLSFFFSFTLI